MVPEAMGNRRRTGPACGTWARGLPGEGLPPSTSRSCRLWAPGRGGPLPPTPRVGMGAPGPGAEIEAGRVFRMGSPPCLQPHLGVLKILGQVGPDRLPWQQTTSPVSRPRLHRRPLGAAPLDSAPATGRTPSPGRTGAAAAGFSRGLLLPGSRRAQKAEPRGEGQVSPSARLHLSPHRPRGVTHPLPTTGGKRCTLDLQCH